MMTLATVDLSLFKSGRDTDRQQFASQLLSGLSQHGFVKLVGHGISNSAISQSFGWVGPQCYPFFLEQDLKEDCRVKLSSRCEQRTSC